MIEVSTFTEKELCQNDDRTKMVNLGLFVLWRAPTLIFVQCVFFSSYEPTFSAQNEMPHWQVNGFVVLLDQWYLLLQVHLVFLLLQFDRVYLHYWTDRVVFKTLFVIFNFIIFDLHFFHSLYVKGNVFDCFFVKLFKIHFLHVHFVETSQLEQQIFRTQVRQSILVLLISNFILSHILFIAIKIHWNFLYQRDSLWCRWKGSLIVFVLRVYRTVLEIKNDQTLFPPQRYTEILVFRRISIKDMLSERRSFILKIMIRTIFKKGRNVVNDSFKIAFGFFQFPSFLIKRRLVV